MLRRVSGLCLGWTLPSVGPETGAGLTDLALLARALVGGPLELQATRRRLKAELHLDDTRMAGEDNPFLMAGSTDEALRRLFAGQGAGHRDRLVRRGPCSTNCRCMNSRQSDAMQGHHRASHAAHQPRRHSLSRRKAMPVNAGVFGRRADKARLWDRYLMMHERLVDALDVLSPELVGQEFARAMRTT